MHNRLSQPFPDPSPNQGPGKEADQVYRRLDLIEDSIEDPFEDSVEDSSEDWCHYEERRPHKTKLFRVPSLSACYQPHARVFPRKTPTKLTRGA